MLIKIPLGYVISTEAQSFDEAAERLAELDISVTDKKIHLIGIQLHHIERMENLLSSKTLTIVQELNHLLGQRNATIKKIKQERALIKKEDAQKKEILVAFAAVKKEICAIRSLKNNLFRNAKRNISTEQFIAKEAQSGL